MKIYCMKSCADKLNYATENAGGRDSLIDQVDSVNKVYLAHAAIYDGFAIYCGSAQSQLL